MRNSKMSIVVPVLMIACGVGWLLTIHRVIPGVDWIWVLGLAAGGVLVLALGGIDKMTVVVGPFLIISTGFSLLRQTGRISIDTEVPSLLIVAGVLILLSRFLPVPLPPWLVTEGARNPDDPPGE